MTAQRPRLHLRQKQTVTNEILIAANVALGERKVEEAVSSYTRVLHDLSPGHASSLLNRSLCYLVTGHFELAAADAYQAALAAHGMRDETKYYAKTRLLAEQSYLRTEALQVNANAKWTHPANRYILDGWAQCSLASIVISGQPDISELDLKLAYGQTLNVRRFSIETREELCTALEIRAIYRLAGALYLCGGGARNDALGLIDDALDNLDVAQWESLFLGRLGKEIMNDIVNEVDDGVEPLLARGNGHHPGYQLSNTSRQDRLESIKESMRMRSIWITHDDYPKWNHREPNLGLLKWQKIFRAWIRDASKKCGPRIVHTDNILDDSWKPYAELFATENIRSGEMILRDHSIFNVTTSHSHKDISTSVDENFIYKFCDVCASLCILPHRDHVPHSRNSLAQPAEQRETSSTTLVLEHSCSKSISNGANSDTKRTYASQRRNTFEEVRAGTSTPSSQNQREPDSKPDSQPDFQFCDQRQLVPLCSSKCSTMHKYSNHAAVCESSLQRAIVQETIYHDCTLPAVEDEQRETRCVHDLILFRLLATCIHQNKDPLHVPEIAYATAGLNLNLSLSACRQTQSNIQVPYDGSHPWSFAHNVIKPINMVHRICAATRSDPFLQLPKMEGWMLNIIIPKIATATHISPPSTKTPPSTPTTSSTVPQPFLHRHFTKFFSANGKYEASYLSSDPHRLAKHDLVSNDAEKEVRVGRLTPLTDLIRAADPDKGEVANVRVEQREGVEVFALGKAGQDVAIKNGETLLRNAEAGQKDESTFGSLSVSSDDWSLGISLWERMERGEGDEKKENQGSDLRVVGREEVRNSEESEEDVLEAKEIIED